MGNCLFLGEKVINNEFFVKKKVFNAVKRLIALGFNNFFVGSTGDFNKLVLETCLLFKKKNKKLNIFLMVSPFPIFLSTDFIDILNGKENQVAVIKKSVCYNEKSGNIFLTCKHIAKYCDIVLKYFNFCDNSNEDFLDFGYIKNENKTIIDLNNCLF